MTATLVLGGPRSGKSRHAEALLARHPQVTCVATHRLAEPTEDQHLSTRVVRTKEGRPEGWRSVETLDLTRALLSSRHPVLIDDLGGWLQGLMDAESLGADPERARDIIDARLDELCVALRGMPFDVVTVSHDPSWGRLPDDPQERIYCELLSHVNQRVSAASSRVLAIMGGRVLDLSDAPLVGSV